MRDDALEPLVLPDYVWNEPETQAALRERRVGYLFQLAQKYAGASQTRIANVTGMAQSEVSRIKSGDRQVTAIDVLERVARGFLMPDRARIVLGLAPLSWTAWSARRSAAAIDDVAVREPAPDRSPVQSPGRSPVQSPHRSPVRSPDRSSAAEVAPPCDCAQRQEAALALQRRLPESLTELVGRADETAHLGRLVRTRRLISLVGPPGIGKTRLALAVAEAVTDRFDGNVVFVSLAEAADGEQVATAFARALGVKEVPGEPVVETVVRQLGDDRVLLVLDNFEHVLTAAPLVRALLSAPRLVILATSRERLRLSGEQVYTVPPLSVPDLAGLPPGDAGVAIALADSPALVMFVLHARGADPGFLLDAANLPAVAELCCRLDGLPLALELAAARIGAFTPEELVSDLTSCDLATSLSLCSAGPRDLPARQRTLYRAIEWSYALLDPEAQALLARLGVFTGGCLLEAAQAVCAPEPAAAGGNDRLSCQLAMLVDKHLLRARPEPDRRTRYFMLETIRAFALGKLAESGEQDAVRARHADFYAQFATTACAGLAGPESPAWYGRVEREYHNLQAALAWSAANDPDLAAPGSPLDKVVKDTLAVDPDRLERDRWEWARVHGDSVRALPARGREPANAEPPATA